MFSTGDGGDKVFDYGTYWQAVNDVISTGEADNFLVSVDALHGAIEVAKYEVTQETNQVLSDKQDQIVAVTGSGNNKTTTPIEPELVPTGEIPLIMRQQLTNAGLPEIAAGGDPIFANKLMLATDVMTSIGILRVPARTTWGANTETKLELAIDTTQQ